MTPARFRPLVFFLVFAVGVVARPLGPEGPPLLREATRAFEAQIREMEAELGENPALDAYRREFEAALPGTPGRRVPPARLARTLAAADLVYLSDLHTYPGAQRAAARFVREMAAGEGPLTAVIEWVDRDDQPALDAFLAGRMTLEDLRRAIEFDRLWGFPWEGYAEIATEARRLGVGLLAVDSLREHLPLGDRDVRVAATVAAHREANPGSRYLVIYGLYHLAGEGHLPDRMRAAGLGGGLRFLGGLDDAYWAALSRVRDPDQIDAIQLAPGLYRAPNGAPWRRRRSYRDHLLGFLDLAEEDLEAEWYLPPGAPAGVVRELYRGR